jgi:hypothetical protein
VIAIILQRLTDERFVERVKETILRPQFVVRSARGRVEISFVLMRAVGGSASCGAIVITMFCGRIPSADFVGWVFVPAHSELLCVGHSAKESPATRDRVSPYKSHEALAYR